MPKKEKSKVLVTGAAGFIGSHMCEFLIHKDFEVFGIDCFTDYYDKKLKQLNANEIKKKGVKLYTVDLASKKFSENIKPDFEYIFHFAAQPGISDNVSFETYMRNNVYATQNLINFALKNKKLKCFINISTSSVYGYEATSPETAIVKPASFY
ncbi:GDP-mannose 4,6-dehydratase, partial [Patescibacteria group bacterium]|nr:GDP-mannose 4,6-dehydratase [Patescibacteria group bacterium]